MILMTAMMEAIMMMETKEEKEEIAMMMTAQEEAEIMIDLEKEKEAEAGAGMLDQEGAAQDIEDMIQENEEKTAVDRDDLFQKIVSKMDSNLRKQQFDTEALLDDINLPKFGSQTVLIVIVSIQLIAILFLISIIAKKNMQQNQNQIC